MSNYESAQHLAEKIVHEGGAAEFVFGYGISSEDLAAVPDLPQDVVGALIMLQVASQFIETIEDWAFGVTNGDEGE